MFSFAYTNDCLRLMLKLTRALDNTEEHNELGKYVLVGQFCCFVVMGIG